MNGAVAATADIVLKARQVTSLVHVSAQADSLAAVVVAFAVITWPVKSTFLPSY